VMSEDAAAPTARGTLPATGGAPTIAVAAVALLLGLALWAARTNS